MIAKTFDSTITTNPLPKSTKQLWTGRAFSGLAMLFLIFDGGIKLMMPAPVTESFARLGYDVTVAPGIGILELVCTILYAVPRTAIVGAVLLTGFLGGAVATHVRVGDPWFTHTFFPLYVGSLIWGGLFLRDAQLRALVTQKFLD